MHRVRTGDDLLRKKVRTGSVDAITDLVYPDLRSPATVSALFIFIVQTHAYFHFNTGKKTHNQG
jgi:hypothetical protein